MAEKWIQWKPVDNLEKLYTANSIKFINTEIIVTLTPVNQSNNAKIAFSASAAAYRFTSSPYDLSAYAKKAICYPNTNWSFFQVENSSYLKWLSKMSSTLSDDQKFSHYVITAKNKTIEMIIHHEPDIDFL